MVIVDSQAKEEEVEKLIKKIEKTVATNGGGKIREVTKLGLKKLTHPIAHKNEGVYYLVNLEIDPIAIKECEGILKLSDIVLRFFTKKLTSPIPEPPVKDKEEEKEEVIKEGK